jgi:hypothetical protein
MMVEIAFMMEAEVSPNQRLECACHELVNEKIWQ